MGFGISHQKAGLKRLVGWIENEIKNAELGIQNSELGIQNGTDKNGAPQRRGGAENGKGSWLLAAAAVRER